MSALREWIKHELLKRDAVLSRPPGQFNVFNYKLRAMQRRGLQIRCAVDGGAAAGDWARELKQIYPDARVLCVEPRQDAQADLQRLQTELPGIVSSRVLLGASEGEVAFNESDVQSSVLNDHTGKPFGKSVAVTMTTLDRLIAQHALPAPDLIKLDLQGYELEALKGGAACLEKAQAVLLEVSFIRLQAGAPIAHEVIAFMHERGYVIYDILSLWQRPLDGALAQGDFLFLRADHSLLSDTRWSAAP